MHIEWLGKKMNAHAFLLCFTYLARVLELGLVSQNLIFMYLPIFPSMFYGERGMQLLSVFSKGGMGYKRDTEGFTTARPIKLPLITSSSSDSEKSQ